MIKVYGTSAEIAGSAAAKPSTAGTSSGWFQSRNVGLGYLPTTVYAWFMNMIQDEILSALTACGITPNASSDAQLGACFATKATKAGDRFTGEMTFDYQLRRYTALDVSRLIPACAAECDNVEYGSPVVLYPGWKFGAFDPTGARKCWKETDETVGSVPLILSYPVTLPPGHSVDGTVKITGWELNIYGTAAATIKAKLIRVNTTTGVATTIGNEPALSDADKNQWSFLVGTLDGTEQVYERYEYSLIVTITGGASAGALSASLLVQFSQDNALL